MRWCALPVVVLIMTGTASALQAAEPPLGKPLPGTQPLSWEGDLAARMVDGVDRFLLRKTAEAGSKRASYWKRDTSSAAAYVASVEPNRRRLAHVLGVRDPRVPFDAPEVVSTLPGPSVIGQTARYNVYQVRWPACGDVTGEGLLLSPKDPRIVANVIAIPDADQTPEQVVGLAEGVAPESQYARRLAESGCLVLVPALIDRRVEPRNGRAQLSSREYLYRSAFVLGRHLIGYELQKILAAVDWMKTGPRAGGKLGVFGWGEGGMLALDAGALDPRIDAVGVSGYFDERDRLWEEPLDRNVFGLLEQFGDAEIASLIVPRPLIVEAAKGPEVIVPPGTGGGPGRLTTPRLDAVQREVQRALDLVKELPATHPIPLIVSDQGHGPFGTTDSLQSLLSALTAPDTAKIPESGPTPGRSQAPFDSQARRARQFHEIDRNNQALLVESPYVRQKFWEKLDTSTPEKFRETIEPYRTYFAAEVIGRFEEKPLPGNAHSRLVYDEPKYLGYEIVLDVFPDVFAYGILLLPKGLKDDEKRPVVICQHGLEGRPQDVADPKINNPAYNQFAIRLAERGFITFAPQNPYIFTDRFRTLQRKANPLKKTLFSVIVPQHQQITDWLKSLPNVDPSRIAFYGLSYGGKSAMRIPPLVANYNLSICSADFNEWVWKNASTRAPQSYVWTGEYEIFEFDLGSTFNYAEMSALIAPRPFMVERGHFDGVAPDETVGYEFAKVRFLYEARLGLKDQCAIEWFVGPHTIHGVGTFDFLHRHLSWPKY